MDMTDHHRHHQEISVPWIATTLSLGGACAILWIIYMILYRNVDGTNTAKTPTRIKPRKYTRIATNIPAAILREQEVTSAWSRDEDYETNWSCDLNDSVCGDEILHLGPQQMQSHA